MKYRSISNYILLSARAIILMGWLFGSESVMSAPLVSIETVNVGEVSNLPDDTGYGKVSYEYSISKYEITLAQYAAFLNAVANQEDPTKPWISDLYDKENMEDATDVIGPLMQRQGSGTAASPYVYSVIGDPNRPVPWVTWFNAARFVNWLNNGAQQASDTENGAYALNHETEYKIIQKNTSATWWLPSEDEWYKAAYYNPKSGRYSSYATRSNKLPKLCASSKKVNSGKNFANYNGCRPEKNKLSTVGSFTGTFSYYGVFDLAGNLWEWTDGVVSATNKIIRGGSWSWGTTSLHKTHRRDYLPQERDDDIGFRVARLPSLKF